MHEAAKNFFRFSLHFSEKYIYMLDVYISMGKIVKVYKINKSYVVVIPKHVVEELEVNEKMLFEVKVEGGRIIYDPL